MRFHGRRVVRADAGAIWDFLLTPGQLRHCLPGCERFEATAPNQYAATLHLGVAFLKGAYHGTVQVTEQQRPDWLGLAVEGSGALGSLLAHGRITFASLGASTEIDYDGEAVVGGRIAVVGERVISATAGRLIDRFFDCLAAQVERA